MLGERKILLEAEILAVDSVQIQRRRSVYHKSKRPKVGRSLRRCYLGDGLRYTYSINWSSKFDYLPHTNKQ